MSRVLKWIALIGLGLVVLVTGAIGAALVLIDPNDYRDDISRIVERKTGRELTIEGDLNLSFWPWLGLELGRTRLSDAPGYADQPFVEIERAVLAVKVLPLLQRQIKLDTVVLEGARVRLIVDEQGRANWEQLVESLTAQEQAQSEPQAAEQPQEQGSATPVTIADIGGLRLVDAYLLYQDRQAGERYEVNRLNFNTGSIRFGAPVSVQSDWLVTMPDGVRLSGELNTTVEMDEAMEQFAARDVDLQLAVRNPSAPGERQSMRLTAQVEGRKQQDDLQTSVNLTVPPFDARAFLAQLLAEPPEMADPKALTQVGLQVALQWANSRLVVNDLQLKLDQSTLRGKASVNSFDPVSAEFDLALDSLDADRYLPPPSEAEDAAASGAPADDLLPVELLRELELKGTVNAGQLTVTGLQLADLKAALNARNGRLQLDPLSTNLYDGSFKGSVTLDVSGNQPRLSTESQLAGVQSGPLLKDMAGDSWVTGRADASATLNMTGNSVDAWMSSLGGNGRFQFKDATVKGINIVQKVREARARLSGQAVPAQADNTTDFAAVSGTFTARSGVIRNDDLKGESPLMRITGKGNVNLDKSTIDYLLTVNLVETLTGQEGRELDDVRRVPIPVRFSGPLDDFKTSVDLKAAIKDLHGERIEEAEQKAKERVEEKRDEVEDRVKQEAKEKLRGLLR